MFATALRAVLTASLVTIFAAAGTALAEPYAPVAKDPGKPTIAGEEVTYPLEQAMLKGLAKNVPDKSAVKQPPYPGAVIVKASPGGKGSMNGVPYTKLPSMILHSTDDVAKVKAFYLEALPDWKKFDYFGMDYLYEGGGEFAPNEKSGNETPHVTFSELPGAMRYHAMPDAITEITIFYK